MRPRNQSILTAASLHLIMDCRVKPGNDSRRERRNNGLSGQSDQPMYYVTSFALVLSSKILISGGVPDSPNSCQRDTT